MRLTDQDIIADVPQMNAEIKKLMPPVYIACLDECLPDAIEEVFSDNDVELESDEATVLLANYKRFVVCFLSIAVELCNKLSATYPKLGKFVLDLPDIVSDIAACGVTDFGVLSFTILLRDVTEKKYTQLTLMVDDNIDKPYYGSLDELAAELLSTDHYNWQFYNDNKGYITNRSLYDAFKKVISDNFIDA